MADLYAEVDALNRANAKRMKQIGKELAQVLRAFCSQLLLATPPAEPGPTYLAPWFEISEDGRQAIKNAGLLSEKVNREDDILQHRRKYPMVEVDGRLRSDFYGMYKAKHGVCYFYKWRAEFVKAIRFAVRPVAKELVRHWDERLMHPVAYVVEDMMHPRMSAAGFFNNMDEGQLVWGAFEVDDIYAEDIIREEMAESIKARKLWKRLWQRVLEVQPVTGAVKGQVDVWLLKHNLNDWIDAKKNKAAAARRAALEVPPAKRVRLA